MRHLVSSARACALAGLILGCGEAPAPPPAAPSINAPAAPSINAPAAPGAASSASAAAAPSVAGPAASPSPGPALAVAGPAASPPAGPTVSPPAGSLLRGPSSLSPPESDGAPSFALPRPGTASAAPRPAPRVLAAAPLPGGAVAYVRAGGAGELVIEDGAEAAPRVLDREVLPSLAVSVAGRLAYARRAAEGCELVLTAAGVGAGRVLYRGATADRLAFREDGAALAFVGTSPEGLAALFVAPVDGAPRQLTNRGLRPRPGGPPPGFVPPPLREGGLRFRGGALRYHAEDGDYIIDARSGAARREAAP